MFAVVVCGTDTATPVSKLKRRRLHSAFSPSPSLENFLVSAGAVFGAVSVYPGKYAGAAGDNGQGPPCS